MNQSIFGVLNTAIILTLWLLITINLANIFQTMITMIITLNAMHDSYHSVSLVVPVLVLVAVLCS